MQQVNPVSLGLEIMTAVDKWNERYAGSDLVWSRVANEEFVRQTKDLALGRALDLGAGEGRNAIWLAQQGWQVTAVDFSHAGLDKGKLLSHHHEVTIDWQVSDACDFEDEAGFDLVAIVYLHTSLDERKRWLPKAIDMVRPGGVFIYIGHDQENIVHGVGGPQMPALLPNSAEIESYLEGFEIQKAGVIHRNVNIESGHGGSRENDAIHGQNPVAFDCLVKATRS